MRLRPIEAHEVSAGRLAVEAGLVALLVLAYLWPFRLYGFDVVDEGTQLAQLARVVAGDEPYQDFETGYTPGYFALYARLLAWGDGTIVTIRTFGAVWQGVLAGGVWAIVRAWGGVPLAVGVTALYVAFLLPVSLRSGAPFNVPYPGWLAAGAALAVQVMVARVSARRIRRRDLVLVSSGLIAGIAFSLKPNAGLLIVAGATLALLPTWAPTALNRTLAAIVRVSASAGALLLLWPGLSPTYLLALWVPITLVAWRTRPTFSDGDAGLRQLGAGAAGFGVVVLPWLVPLVLSRGPSAVLREVFLLDGGVVAAYLLPFPAPGLATIVLALGALSTFAFRGRPTWWPAIVVASLGLGAVVGIAQGPVRVAENVLLWLGPIAIVLGFCERDDVEPKPREYAALAFLSVYSLQLFPRPDALHVLMGGAPLALGTVLLWRRYARAWAAGTAEPFASQLARVALALACLLAIARAGPAWIARVGGVVAEAGLGPRAPVVVLETERATYAPVRDRLRAVERLSAAGERIFAFPDQAGLGFLAARRQPYHYLYFVPGRPDHVGEERTLRDLAAASPDLVFLCRPSVPAFAAATEYFTGLVGEIQRQYVAVEEVAGCVVSKPRKARG